jgi:hypothetical protein
MQRSCFIPMMRTTGVNIGAAFNALGLQQLEAGLLR